MIILALLLGLSIGWAINQASDYLPRFAAVQSSAAALTLHSSRQPALWNWLHGGSDQPWIRLHVAVEIASAIFTASLWLFRGVSEQGSILLAGYIFFALITVIDIKFRLVLNVVLYPAAVLILLIQGVAVPGNVLNLLLGGAFAFLVFYGAALIRPGGLGGGDIKLAALIGLMLGFPGVLVALIFGAAATTVFLIFLFARHTASIKMQLPYAPFLCFGGLAALVLMQVGGLS